MRLALILVVLACAAGCGEKRAPARTGGDAENGRLLLRQFGCGACHEIPEVADARGQVGPPLRGVAGRVYLAGNLPTTPENMIAFIRDPAAFAPRTTMPNLGVTETHARDMVAYLYTLE